VSESPPGEAVMAQPIAFEAPPSPGSGPLTSAQSTVFPIIAAISFCHLLNDMMQSMLAAIYPMLKASFGLSFGQIGLLTFTYQLTASLLQPMVGLYTDKRPMPYSLPCAMAFTLVGLVGLAFAHAYWLLLIAAGMVGVGSSVFHPESSRVARMASPSRCSRWAAISAQPSAPCWRPSSSCPAVSPASPSSQAPLWWR